LGHQTQAAHSASEGLSLAAADPPDMLLLDINLPDKLGLEILPQLKRDKPGLVVVMMTASAEIKHAVEAMRAGAEDYLAKPLNLDELELLVGRVEEKLGLQREVAALKNALREGYAKEYLFLKSPAMAKVYSQIEKVAAQEKVTVLILGETGTGKEHAARLIHLFSKRSAKPFVELHCGAFPETLLESELFGYEAGAFTDAKKQKKGLFETAQGGTVFLDEVGELPMTVQTKLLKVLEQKILRRLGGTKEIALDVRIVSATNRNLEKEVEAGNFRPDLFYRLNVFPVSIPPLRERPEDMESLIGFFFREACSSFGKIMEPLGPAVFSALRACPWPGNTRQLKNVLNRMVLTAQGEEVRTEDIPEEVLKSAPAPAGGGLSMAGAEKQNIRKVLEKTGGNKSLTARELGISRNTLLSKMKKHNLK